MTLDSFDDAMGTVSSGPATRPGLAVSPAPAPVQQQPPATNAQPDSFDDAISSASQQPAAHPAATDWNEAARTEINRRKINGVPLNPSDEAAIIEAYRVNAGNQPQRPSSTPQQIAQSVADNSGHVVNATAAAQAAMARHGAGWIGSVAPKTAANLQENADLVYGHRDDASGKIGGAVGGTIASVPAMFGGPAGLVQSAVSAAGNKRVEAEEMRRAGQTVSGADEAKAAIGAGAVDLGTQYLAQKLLGNVGGNIAKRFGGELAAKVAQKDAAGAATSILKAIGVDLGKEVAGNQLISQAQNFAQNLVDHQTLHPERKLTDGSGDAAINAFLQSVLLSPLSAHNARRGVQGEALHNITEKLNGAPAEATAPPPPEAPPAEAPKAPAPVETPPPPAVEPPPAFKKPEGADTKIVTRTGPVDARYEVIEAASLKPSHDPFTFQPNAQHVGGQERQYQTDKNEQLKVIEYSGQKFDSRHPLSDDPSPANGAPMVLDDGSVIGGNGRTMILRRVYADPARAPGLKHDVVSAAAKFGLDPNHVAQFNEPVIVRRLTGESSKGMTPERAAALSRKLQHGLTQGMDQDADHASRAKILLGNPDSLATIERVFTGDKSVREVLADPRLSRQLLEHMQKAGVVTPQEASQFFTADGQFTKPGKDLVEGVLLRTVVDDPRLLDDVPHAITTKLTGNLSHLAYARSRPGFDLSKPIKSAIEAYHRFRAAGAGADADALNTWLNVQQTLTPDPIQSDPKARRILESLVGDNSKEFKSRLERYAEDAKSNMPGQGRMFGGDVTPDEAFRGAFGGEASPVLTDASAGAGKYPAELADAKAVGDWYAKTFNDEAGAPFIETLAGQNPGKFVRRDVPVDSIDPNNAMGTDVQPMKVKRYAAQEGEAPPVIAVNGSDGKYMIADGTHRLLAAKQRGDATISAYVPEEGAPPAAELSERRATEAAKANQPPPANAAPATPGSVPGPHLVPSFQKVPMPELVRLATDLFGMVPKVKGLANAHGSFNTMSGELKIDRRTPADPLQLARTMAHEIGHGIDWLPDKMVGIPRGDVLNRVMSLNPINAHLAAMRLALHDLAGRADSAMIAKEAEAISAWWRPGDMTTKYRASAVEKYADVLSVFLNDPGALESRAPNLYREFVRYMGEKPEVMKGYMQIQGLLNGLPNDLAANRAEAIIGDYGAGEDAVRAAQEEVKAEKQSPGQLLKQLFLATHWPFLRKLNEAVKAGKKIPEGDNPRYFFEEMQNSSTELHRFVRDVKDAAVDPLVKAGLDTDHLGMYLQFSRIAAGDRAEVANPRGHTPETANEMLGFLKSAMTPHQWTTLESSARALRSRFWQTVEAAHASGLISHDAFAAIEPNKESYATFAILDHLQDHIGAALYKQVGTFKATANPFANMLMKAQSLIRATAYNDARNAGKRFLRNFPDEITDFKPRPVGPGRVSEPPPAPKGREWLHSMVNGRPHFSLVDSYFAKAYRSHDLGLLRRVTSLMSDTTYKVFHPLYVSWNLSWQGMNYIKDPFRSMRNYAALRGPRIPGLNAAEYMKAWFDSIPAALRRARGITDATVEQMMKEKALDVAFVQYDGHSEDSKVYDRMLGLAGLGDHANEATWKKVLMTVPRAVEAAAVFSETLPKIAMFKALERNAPNMSVKERAYSTRNYAGTPNIHKRGLATPLTNAVFMYSNVALQGLTADSELATKPGTRAGWWMHMTLTNLLPRMAVVAAIKGLFGDDIKEMFGAIGDYDRTNYLCLPFGWHEGEDGKRRVMYVRLPYDHTGQVVGGITQKVLEGHWIDHPEKALTDLLGVAGTQNPFQLSPLLNIASKWATYAAGANPVDSFRNQPILSDDAQKARGTAGLARMTSWTRDQLGQAGDLIRGVESVTGIGGKGRDFSGDGGLRPFFKVSDLGVRQAEQAAIAEKDAASAETRLAMPASVRKISAERFHLDRLKDPEQEARRRALNGFWRDVYLPTLKRIKAAEAAGDDQTAKQLRDQLGEAADGM